MTPTQLLSIVAARWRVAVLVLLLSVGATTGISLTMLKQYTATASVMLDARSPDQIAGGALNAVLPGGYMATQIDLINSERVARSVIRSLGLKNDVALRDKWLEEGRGSGDFEAWLAELLQKNLSVRPAPVSNVITIAYSAKEGPAAAEMVNTFVKAYVDTSLELRMERVRQYGDFFDERAKQLRDELQAAQAKLSAYQQKHGLVVGDERLDVETSRLAELGSQLLQLQGTNAETAGRLKRAGRQPEQLQEVLADPVVAALGTELTREEIRMRELTSRLGESHPQLLEQRTRVAELKSRLAAATTRASGSVEFNNSVSQVRLAQLTSALEAQRARVLRTQSLREQAVTLQRDVENAQRAYAAMQLRVSQSSFEIQNTYTNVTVLKHATAPMKPSSAKVLKYIAAGLIAGALAAVGAALGLEVLDRRMRSPDDIAELKQPLLVLLPVSTHARRVADTSRIRLTKQRVMTGLPRPNLQA